MSPSLPRVCIHFLFFELERKEKVSYEITLVGKEKCDNVDPILFNNKIFVT